jgi:hypothetical protein
MCRILNRPPFTDLGVCRRLEGRGRAAHRVIEVIQGDTLPKSDTTFEQNQQYIAEDTANYSQNPGIPGADPSQNDVSQTGVTQNEVGAIPAGPDACDIRHPTLPISAEGHIAARTRHHHQEG